MNLHNEIMNLQCRVPKDANINQQLSWTEGHKQARHDAAELANAADAELERLLKICMTAKEALYSGARDDLEVADMLEAAFLTPNVELRGQAAFGEAPLERRVGGGV